MVVHAIQIRGDEYVVHSYHLLKSGYSTVWIFQHFSVIQNLREINFGESRSSKTAVFAIFGALNFLDLVDFNLQKVQKFMKIKNQSV